MIRRSMVSKKRSVRADAPSKKTSTGPKTGTDEKYIDPEIQKFLTLVQEEGFEAGTDTQLAMTCLSTTHRHDLHSLNVIDDFIQCLRDAPNSKWIQMLSPVANPFRLDRNSPNEIPALFLMCSGKENYGKRSLANLALIEWQGRTRMKNVKGDSKLIWYQPSTQNQRLRTFFGTMCQRFDWQFTLNSFLYAGGLDGFLKALYSSRLQKYADVSEFCFLFFFILKI
jgi:hypothetical protein